MSFTYSKTERLKSRKRIDQLFLHGKSMHTFPFRVVYKVEMASELDKGIQAGVGVSKQYFKHAVDRNRIKRLMREAWRLQKVAVQQMAVAKNLNVSVFILFRGNEMPGYELISNKMSKVIEQLIKVIDEKNADHL